MNSTTHQNIAQLFEGHWNRNYAVSKLRTDPLYQALHSEIGSSSLPLLDLGCGIGISAFFLRAHGSTFPITGLDYDQRKISVARHAADKAGIPSVTFSHHDARLGLPDHLGNVAILDILQFFNASEQESLLKSAASRVSPGGKLVIRSGISDSSWRFKITVAGDLLAKATRWMKAAPTHYPTTQDFHRILSPFGSVSISPLWGGTPFNNHLVVLSRPSHGTPGLGL